MCQETNELHARLELARKAAHDAGQRTLHYFQSDQFDVDRKDDNSPVTIADREAEEILRQHITRSFPADAILGEELGERPGNSGYRWILDPIDGTTAFVSGVPLYGTLVGVEFDQQSVIGVLCVPALEECVFAAKGQGAWHQVKGKTPIAARVSSRQRISDGLFVTSQVDLYERRGVTSVFEELQRRAYITRTWGDSYGYLLVATGRAEVMIDPEMKIWDAAPMQPILEEAGGTFTDWQGTATIHHREGIATNGHVLQEVLDLTR